VIEKVKRIALIGPESSGKTTLCKQLAEHYHTQWVPEYSREHVAELNRKYTLQDIEHCYREQLKQEKELINKANQFIFSDTELIVAKVWCEDVFKTAPEWIEKNIEPEKYDLYLLTFYDLPWLHDPVRENPHRREFFYEWYKRELESRNFPYKIIKGEGEKRFRNALDAIMRS